MPPLLVVVVGLPLPLAPPLLFPPSVVVVLALLVVFALFEGLPLVVLDALDGPVVVVPSEPTVVLPELLALEPEPPPLVVLVPAELALEESVSVSALGAGPSPPQWVNENNVPRQTERRAEIDVRMNAP